MSLSLTSPEQKWSYADLISSYRFWGLVLFYLMLTLSMTIHSIYTSAFLRNELGFSAGMIGQFITFRSMGIILGFIPAWFISRIKNVYPLFIVGLLFILGIAIIHVGMDSPGLILLGELLIGLSQGCIMLLLPAYIAGAVGSIELFIVAFGTCSLLKMALSTYLPMFLTEFIGYGLLSTSSLLTIVPAIYAILALLLLLPVKKALFYAQPRDRVSAVEEPLCSSPIAVALLFIVPFYYIFWFARIHREIHFLERAPHLMTSQGAGWAVFLVPLAMPAICVTLSDELGERLAAKGKEIGVRTGWVLFWGLFLPPVAAAMIQSKMNRLSDKKAFA